MSSKSGRKGVMTVTGISRAPKNFGKISAGTSYCLGAQADFAERPAFHETFKITHIFSVLHLFCSALHHLVLLFII